MKAGSNQSAERAERADHDLFELLVESVQEYAIFMLDPGGRVTTWNVGAERIKGYSAAEILGRHFSAFYPPEDVRAGKCERALETAAGVGRFEDEGWRLRRDGSRFWASVVIGAVRDADGALLGFSKVTRDLTERKRAEVEKAGRLAAEERFRLLIESVVDYAIFMLDPGGRVATWNVGAERIKGYSAAQIIGRHFSTFYPEEDVRAGKCEYELEVAAHVGRFEDEGWRVRRDGSRFWANVIISAVRDRQGTLVGFSKVTRDLTERKRAEEQHAARLAAEAANRAKDEFLAMLGHELRNPMAPILTALQLMKRRGDAQSSKEQEIIERQVHHMVRLVDDLLDVSRITRGKVSLKKRHIDLKVILAKAAELTSPLLEQRRHRFRIEAPAGALLVDADEARLTQVFANLLTNAAKYTEPGGDIRVAIRAAGTEVVTEVRDSGIGIEPALLPAMFDLFVQGPQSLDRSSGGLGLGLALVRSLVSLHGGSVEAWSAGPGTGSTLTVRLPLREAQVDAPAAPASSPAAVAGGRRILLVDDNEDARLLLADALAAAGHEVRSASDPAEALDALGAFTPEVAILDIGLPVMDGYELAERLRAALPAAAPRLIALTGYGRSGDHARSAAAGFDAHLVKPVDIERLLQTIDELGRGPRPER